jgi:hypothetical protein
MDQDALVELLARQVDGLGSLLTWYATVTLAATYAILREEKKVSIGPVSVDARHVQTIGSALLIVFGIGILVALFRIRAILLQLDYSHIKQGLTVVLLSSSIVNPFAYFGPDLLSRVSSVVSYVLFFTITGVAMLPVISSEGKNRKLTNRISWAWFLIGALICVMLFVDLRIIQLVASRYSAELSRNLESTFMEKNITLPLVPFIITRLHLHIQKWRTEALMEKLGREPN